MSVWISVSSGEAVGEEEVADADKQGDEEDSADALQDELPAEARFHGGQLRVMGHLGQVTAEGDAHQGVGVDGPAVGVEHGTQVALA